MSQTAVGHQVPAYLGRVLDGNGVGVGTCFQLSPGVLVTAWHVLHDIGADGEGSVVSVDPLGGGDRFTAALKARDEQHDLAVMESSKQLAESISGLAATDFVAMSTEVVVTGVSEVYDPGYDYRYLEAPGIWAGKVSRNDEVVLGRLRSSDVVPGMSGAPVRRLSDGMVVGVVTARYNAADGWLSGSVWVARTERLGPLVRDLSPPSVWAQTVHDARRAGYRAPSTPSGYFRRPGEIHAHIDGATHPERVLELIRALSEPSAGDAVPLRGKFNRIINFDAGPQRELKNFRSTYDVHTPGTDHREAFDSFATVWLGHGDELNDAAIDALAAVITSIQDQPGAVVELEYVLGVLTEKGWDRVEPVAHPKKLDDQRLARFRRRNTSPVEIHHSVDIPKDTTDSRDKPVLPIDDLVNWPSLGGWFLFDKGDTWSYRSSEFAGWSADYRYEAQVGQHRLKEYLDARGIRDVHLVTIVEQVLAIWRGEKKDPSTEGGDQRAHSFSIPQLGAWEMSRPEGSEYWVIAANFFGDRSPDVGTAMVKNLMRKVRYTYFLRSYADALRLSLLVEDLKRKMRLVWRRELGSPSVIDTLVSQQVQCVLLFPAEAMHSSIRELLESDYFLCPYGDGKGGFRLERHGLSGEKLDNVKVDELIAALNPLVMAAKVHGLLRSPDQFWQRGSQVDDRRAIACTELRGMEGLGRDDWIEMLEGYDAIIARALSMYAEDGMAVRPIRNGYLLVFSSAEFAAAWAKRVQFDIEIRNKDLMRKGRKKVVITSHGIALGFGTIKGVLRAHGDDFIGQNIDECIQLLRTIPETDHGSSLGQIRMSEAFQREYEQVVGKSEFAATSVRADLSGTCLLKWP